MTTAVHMWRFYFRYDKADPSQFSAASRNNWDACDRAVKQFNLLEQTILKKYYLTSYGDYDDLKCIKEYCQQNGIKESDAWDAIKKANYEVIVELGLMDRKGDGCGTNASVG